MSDVTSTWVVPLFFLGTTVGTAILSWWFLNKKQASLKYFGWGMLGYAAGFAVWSYVVLTKPTDLKSAILVGVIPFLLAHIAYAKSAGVKYKKIAGNIMLLTVLLLVATFLARTFFYPSEPYFSDKGLLFFGLQPVPVALYIATISVSFLPAIRAVVSDMKQASLRTLMSAGLTILYVNSIIFVTAKDDTLLTINGFVLGITLIVLWVKALSTPNKA